MMSNSVPFIGRQAELALVEQLLEQWGTRIVLCIEGPGGIGKTRLLQEIIQRYQATPQRLTTGILDFDMPDLRVPDNLSREIARRVGKTYFREYRRQLRKQYHKQQAGASYEELAQGAQVARQAFERGYHALAGEYRLLVLMDTLEKVYNTEVWPDIIELIRSSANTLFVLSGRRHVQAAWQALLPQIGGDSARFISLEPFDAQESIRYIQTKEKKLHLSLDPALRAKLVQIAAGRPILIDLASEWVARDIPLPWLTNRSTEELKQLTDLLPREREELEAALVRPIESLPAPLYSLILHLAYVYPMDGAIMTFLLGILPDDQPKLFRELKRLAFVKPLPNATFALHDEMRRMIKEYIWNDIDPERSVRRQISERMARYFDEQAAASSGGLAGQASGKGAGKSEIALGQDVIRQEYWVLRERQLFHQLRSDLDQGFELFLKLFKEATRVYQYPVRSTFLNDVQSIADHLSADQQYELGMRRAQYLLDTGHLDNVDKAQHLLGQLMSAYADGGEREVALLTRLANCAIKSGHAPDAPPFLERARELAQNKLPNWVDTIQNTLGYAYRLAGRLDVARTAYQKALDYVDDAKTAASIYNNLGFIECLHGEYEAGLRYCEQAREIRQQLGLRRELAMSFSTLGDLYRYWGRYSEALEQINKAIEIFQPSGDREWLARVYAHRGALHRMQARTEGDLISAIADLRRSLDQNVITEIPYAMYILGGIYKDMGDLEQALRLFEQSDVLAVKNFNMYVHANNLVGCAEIYLLKWEQERKPEYRENILQRAAKIKQVWDDGYQMFHHIGRMTHVCGDLAYAEGLFDAALDHYIQAYSLLAGRYAGYGRRTFHDELNELEKRMSDLPPQQAIEWCDRMEQAWSDPARDIRRRESLLSVCRVRRTEARLKLMKT